MTPPDAAADTHLARPYWQASGEDALLLFFVFGTFSGATDEIAHKLHLPDGIALTRYAHAALKNWDGYPLAGSLGALFAEEAPQALAAARATPDVLRIAGDVRDPATLDYLRDTLNAVTRLLDAGGVAVVDPQISGLFDRARWHRQFVTSTDTTLRQHVLILCDADPDDDACQWVHTRGLRKFGRPDLSLTRVPATATNAAGALCGQLVDMLALGGSFIDGQVLEVDGLPGPLMARLDANPEDPRFSNTHVELPWPA